MPPSDATEIVLDHQRAWAAKRGVDLDPQGRSRRLEDNLFQPLNAATRSEYARAAGNELGTAETPGDMRSLRSSSALVCNVFDYWRDKEPGLIAAACGADPEVSEIAFEVAFPTGLSGTPPHLDVLLSGHGALPTAIESKFTEAYEPHEDEFRDSYFRDASLWRGLAGCRRLAEQLRDRAMTFQHLGAAQLLKHALGLERRFGHRKYRLLLLWFSVEGPQSAALRNEIEFFRDRLSDEIRFDAMTYQELFGRIKPHLTSHAEYREYLEQRYFSGDLAHSQHASDGERPRVEDVPSEPKRSGIVVIGIDCATDPRKVGLALGTWGNEGAKLVQVGLGDDHESLASQVVSWLPGSGPALIALDAPLGWPKALGPALVRHVAGEAVSDVPNSLFRRGTDRFVKQKIGKQPLDVGADRIARTAHAALKLLAEVRELSGCPIPLAWSSRLGKGPASIEVYPAATLVAHGLPASGYKKPQDADQRRRLVEALGQRLRIEAGLTDLLLSNADVLDAAVCVLAAFDFLEGRAGRPTDLDEARREGWIWVAGKQTPPR